MSRNKQKRRNKHWQRKGKFNRHHIKNKCRGGRTTKENLLWMDIERHNAFHFLFKNMSFREVAALLIRCSEMKGEKD